ncbi:nucleoside recognition domain-containing protein [Desulfitibacter alkalitolerans]|uniref:nucleoside recognition domain-containing protein n=1 Tax=Desulfitibacter alkalitolerans TaxID=264641 RepID=UPI00047F76FF|nr:nucleoside recognition domain-containing protein [Desulfitibacter alkalitolerans]
MVLINALKKGLFHGIQLTYDIAKIIVPIYIVLSFLEAVGVLERVALVAEPLMKLVGLPGEMSLALVLGNVLNMYAAIGVIVAVGIDVKQLTIISVMLLFSHTLPVELSVAKKTGIRVAGIAILRISVAFISGILLNIIL